MEITRRYRVNFNTSVKGIKTYDCTVEINCDEEDYEAAMREMAIEESDALVAELDKRYPTVKE